ncbi:unnamed protein product [Clonostachys rosea]|uniref:2EXR domain-containing protein n=1 Tax=Bionectria ochroleuca TaxID=29856 RepID=A0ABY6U6F1_BIOOC|nr:unnamed protein product [Clonostachys rosea]
MTSITQAQAGVSPQQLTHFHLFPKLPTEIRLKIWRSAICIHETPRLHYYSLFNEDYDGYRQSFLPRLISIYMNLPGRKKQHLHPKDKKPKRFDRRLLRSNPSQFTWAEASRVHYYWNAGLRTACWESRTALTEYYTRLVRGEAELSAIKELSRQKSPPPTKPSPSEEDLSSNRPLSGDEKNKIALERTKATLPVKGENVYLDLWTVDIVCFRFPKEHMAACVYFEWDEFLTRLPFFQLPYVSDLNLAFEFEDGWEKGLGDTRESVCEHLSEASTRGLVMRAWWDWQTGRIPSWARMYLINPRNDLPRHYRLADGFRYFYDPVYSPKYHCKTGDGPIFVDEQHRYFDGQHRSFFDGEKGYVESYSWDEDGPDFLYIHNDVPICNFILKMERFCRPVSRNIDVSLPNTDQHFFRVLRLLPGDKTPPKI